MLIQFLIMKLKPKRKLISKYKNKIKKDLKSNVKFKKYIYTISILFG